MFCLHSALTHMRLESANEPYRNTVKDLVLQNAISQKNEKLNAAGLDDNAIPHIKI